MQKDVDLLETENLKLGQGQRSSSMRDLAEPLSTGGSVGLEASQVAEQVCRNDSPLCRIDKTVSWRIFEAPFASSVPRTLFSSPKTSIAISISFHRSITTPLRPHLIPKNRFRRWTPQPQIHRFPRHLQSLTTISSHRRDILSRQNQRSYSVRSRRSQLSQRSWISRNWVEKVGIPGKGGLKIR